MDALGVHRVLDANLNRLREGVRVVEEYYRFISENESCAKALKEVRHKVREINDGIPQDLLLQGRDSASDIFASGVVAKESERSGFSTLLAANIKRAQEASRVLEEYLKLIDKYRELSNIAKEIRFALYTIEKTGC